MKYAHSLEISQEIERLKDMRGNKLNYFSIFFDVFGVSIRRITSLEDPVKNLGKKRDFIDLFWKGMPLVEQKSICDILKNGRDTGTEVLPGPETSYGSI